MFLSAVGAKDDPNSGGRQMPSHWGHKALNIVSQSSPTGTQCLHAVGCAEAGRALRAAARHSRSRTSAVPGRRSHLRLDRRRHDERRRILGIAEHRLRPQGCRSSSSSKTTATRSRCRSKCRRPAAASRKLVEQLPGPEGPALRRHRHPRQPRDDDRGRGVLPRAPRARRSSTPRSSVPYSHSLSDDERLYKTPAERAEEATRDPITKCWRVTSSRKGFATDADLDAIAKDVDREVNEAADAAIKAPKPPKDTAGLWVYSPDVDPTSAAFDAPLRPEGKPDTMVAAINRTMKDEMAAIPRIVIFGEDVADATHEQKLKEVQGKGGVFKVTHGLQKAYGGDRVFNSPLAEANIIGRAVGMAVARAQAASSRSSSSTTSGRR